jgi:hypothetical protein
MQKMLIAALLTLAFAMTACSKTEATTAAPAEGAAPAAATTETAQ